ncbi:MAG: hypothetical protein QOH49_4265 [Acidobacteriota bacterium]|nr:hypothetical protein [Acidobacteriota bacterium]
MANLLYHAPFVKRNPDGGFPAPMRATRRRQRRPDPLARPEAVRAVCEELRSRMPGVIPNSERQLVRFLYAVRHVERRPATDTKRGRPSRWRREDLGTAASHLRAVLGRETSKRVSLNSFLGQYLLILNFPPDVQDALSDGRANLQEAAQLARLTPARLNRTPADARRTRAKLLKAHLAVQGSQTRLRERVRELLGESWEPGAAAVEAVAVLKADVLLEADPLDSTHLFYEELRRIGWALRGVRPEDLTGEDLDALIPVLDELGAVLLQIERRNRRKDQDLQRLTT